MILTMHTLLNKRSLATLDYIGKVIITGVFMLFVQEYNYYTLGLSK